MDKMNSIFDLAEACLVRAGKVPSSYAPEVLIREAQSTSDFPTLVSNVQNKVMLKGYDYRAPVYPLITEKRSVKDFKDVTALRMNEYDDLVEVQGTDFAQAFDHTHDGTEVITYGVTLYAIMVENLWKLLIEDDIGAFNLRIQRLGRAAARTKERHVAELFNNGATTELYDPDGVAIFNAAHSNIQATALTEANLATAINLLLAQTDNSGNPIDVGGFSLMASSTVYQAATQLWAQSGGIQQLVARVARESAPAVFDQVGMINVLHNNYLDAGTWYLVCDPMDVPCIEMGELRGLELPLFLESAGHWKQTILGFNLSRNMTTENAVLQGYRGKWSDFRGAVKGN